MRKDASPPLLRARRRAGWGVVWWGALGAASICSCATGVDVSDEELAAICEDPDNRCGGSAGSSGNAGGSTGGGLGGSASGGTFNNGGSGQVPSNGGSFGTNAGTGGSLGTSGSGGTGAMVPLAEGDCLPTDDIVVLYQDRTNGAASEDEPSMVMQVQNPAGASFPLSDLAIRYWFTADGTGNFTGTVDYASVNGQGDSLSGITISFSQEFGSDYAEMTFPAATDMVGAQGISQLQLRFHAQPYAAMNQANDFSFISGAVAGTPNRNITPYLRNEQVGGCVPIPP
jgi:hypothetical protein